MRNDNPRSTGAARAGGMPAALELIDEAVVCLRNAPRATLGIYYAGSVPFVVVLGCFWTGMTRGGLAKHSTGASIGMVVLFLAMKISHAVFAARVRSEFGVRPASRWTPGRLGRLALVQTLIQPSGMFLLPAAALITLPLGWVYAFYGSVTVVGDGESASAGRVFIRAARHALRDPKGNHLALLILGLLGVIAWTNLVVATLFLPQIAEIVTAKENVFTRMGLHIFNAPFFAVTIGLVYLALDPIAKTFYALRCFYADALHTGEDLEALLRALPERVAECPPAMQPAAAPAAPR